MPSVMDLAALLSVLTLVTQLSDKNKVDQLESEIKRKVAELDAKSLSLDASEGENDRLRTDAATEVISEESTSTRLAEAEASKAMVEESTRLSVERKFLKGRNDELVNTLSNMRQICADLEQQCKDLTATVDSYAEDLSEYDQKIEDVRKARDEAKTEATRLNKKLEQAETDIQLYISQVKSLEEALGDSRSQIRDYKSCLTASTKEVKTLTDENACLKDELQSVQGSHGSPWIDVNVDEATTSGVQAEANVIEFDASDDGRLPDTPLKRPLRPRKLSQSAAPPSKFEASASPPSDYDINEMTVAKLKEFLKSMNVKPKGLKLDLLEQALAAAREERERLSRLNDGKSAS
ncbi:hypothetical protein BDN71DRAFT_1454196 [Pleurotus eryngii]|uniref:SAP domain-containing protein n=1 Tax=Pleurotus eryngii TaxID=5323 RepID=A0A9P6D2Y7_PLEER|nr:hypothetical protein BDN71DRAFT_1454196 [Pleurotus eryngii]